MERAMRKLIGSGSSMGEPLEPRQTRALVSTGTESDSEAGGRLLAGHRSRATGRGVPMELILVWTVLLVVAVEIVVTYSRLPAADLYHVSGTGLDAGLGRLVVWLNYPLALVALAATLILIDRFTGTVPRVVGAVALVLSSFIFWPGIVEQSDLDAKVINVVPALGTSIAVGLTIALLARSGVSPAPGLFDVRGDHLRVAIIIILPLLAVPWLLADLGFSLDGVPVLGAIWQTGELRSQPGVAELHPAVHHGHHHGMDGVLLTFTVLLLSRRTAEIAAAGVRRATAAFLSLMLAYGLFLIANDFWLEQIVKRQWTSWEVPDVTRPSFGGGWAVIVAATIIIYAVWFSRSEGLNASPGAGLVETA
jgi:hypothetical protein